MMWRLSVWQPNTSKWGIRTQESLTAAWKHGRRQDIDLFEFAAGHEGLVFL
jgi:hypothetical protein